MAIIKNINSELSIINSRLRQSAIDILTEPASLEDAIFQHSVLCQTFLPYRNPGNEKRIWQHKQGHVSLAIQANEIINPLTGDFEFIGLPYGPMARLILAHINSEAVKTQSKLIDVEASMTVFIKKIGLYEVPDNGNFTIPQTDLRRFPAGAMIGVSISRAIGLKVPMTTGKTVFLFTVSTTRTIPCIVKGTCPSC